jgi:membrane-associated phospholipid phosphatase
MGATALVSAAIAVVLTLLAWAAVVASRPAAMRLRASPASQRLARHLTTGWDWVSSRVAAQLLVLVAGAAVVFALGAVFTEITEAVLDQDDLTAVDRPALAWLARHRDSAGSLTQLEIGITHLGDATTLTALLVAMAGFVAVRSRSWRPIILTAVAAGGIQLLVYAIKLFIGRARPDPAGRLTEVTGFSFPSGHSASAAVCFGMLAWLVCMATSKRTIWATAWLAAALLTVAVGQSRVYLAVHYPSDVLGGWVLGSTWLATVATASYLASSRRPKTGSPAQAEIPSSFRRYR